jgi:hypothetical protein
VPLLIYTHIGPLLVPQLKCRNYNSLTESHTPKYYTWMRMKPSNHTLSLHRSTNFPWLSSLTRTQNWTLSLTYIAEGPTSTSSKHISRDPYQVLLCDVTAHAQADGHTGNTSCDGHLLLLCDVTTPAPAARHTGNTACSTVACAYRVVSIEPLPGNALTCHTIYFRMLVFLGYVLFENSPTIEKCCNFFHSQMFRRTTIFWAYIIQQVRNIS